MSGECIGCGGVGGECFCDDFAPLDDFSYVNITGDKYKGWLNLFIGEYCIALIQDRYVADLIRLVCPEKEKTK